MTNHKPEFLAVVSDIKDCIETVTNLAAYKYTPREIAIYFGIDIMQFKELCWDKTSDISKAYDRGFLIAKAEISMASLNSAKGGNVSQIVLFNKDMKQKQFDLLKDKLLNGKF